MLLHSGLMHCHFTVVKQYYECINKNNKEQPYRALMTHLVVRISAATLLT